MHNREIPEINTTEDAMKAMMRRVGWKVMAPIYIHRAKINPSSMEALRLARIAATAPIEIKENPSLTDDILRNLLLTLAPYSNDALLLDYLACFSVDPITGVLYYPGQAPSDVNSDRHQESPIISE